MKKLTLALILLSSTTLSFATETEIVTKTQTLSAKIAGVSYCGRDLNPVSWDGETWVPSDRMLGEEVVDRVDHSGERRNFLVIKPNVTIKTTYRDYSVEQVKKRSGKIVSEKIIEGSFSEPYTKLSIVNETLESEILDGENTKNAANNLVIQCNVLHQRIGEKF